jgi:CRP-like cAMP-binding protein
VTIGDLRKRKLFKDVPAAILRRLLQGGEVGRLFLQPRVPLRLQVGKVEYVYVIVSGYLEVRLNSQLIKKGSSLLIAFRGPEQIVGEIRAISKGAGEAFISAVGTCELIAIPSRDLTRLAERDWRIYRNIAALLIEKSLQERKRQEVTQMREGEAQVAQTLLNFIAERGTESVGGKQIRINGSLRQRNIADYIGCDRSTVAKRLSRLKAQHIIDYPPAGRRELQFIAILDLLRLERVAQGK